MRHALKWIPVEGKPGKSIAHGWEPGESYELYCHERGRWSSYFIARLNGGLFTATLSINQTFWTARRAANDHHNHPSRGKAHVY